MTTKVIETLKDIPTVGDLAMKLMQLDKRSVYEMYVTNAAGEPITVELIETMLTDGSAVLDVIIR